jgi:hypothetical protein
VRDDLSSIELWLSQSDRPARDRLPAIEDTAGNCGGPDSSISVVDLVNIGDVRDVGNIRHVADVRDVHFAYVLLAAVIPRKEGLTRSQREPRR